MVTKEPPPKEPQPCLACKGMIQTFSEWFSSDCPATETGHTVPTYLNLPLKEE